MSNTKATSEFSLHTAGLYPELSVDQRAEATYFLTRYFEVVEAIAVEKSGLTDSGLNATV